MTHLFEGHEKKLEIILRKPQEGLRCNRDQRWNRVVRASGADILSKISNSCMDAWLLSESGLFVWENRIRMITCGRTTLTASLPEIFRFVDRRNVDFLFYERKNMMYPHQQPYDFKDDAAFLQFYSPGSRYRIGPADCDHIHLFHSCRTRNLDGRDSTFQLLMSDIDPRLENIFSAQPVSSDCQTEKTSILKQLYPDMVTDSYFFSPFGYSLNAIHNDCYFTVHVTPQPQGSYASFETNIMETDYSSIGRKVISFFHPKKFSLILTTNMTPASLQSRPAATPLFPGYHIAEKVFCELASGFATTLVNQVRTPGEN